MRRLIALTTAVASATAFAGGIELTIEPITNVLLVTVASGPLARPPGYGLLTASFPHPDSGWPVVVTANNIVHLPDNPSPEVLAWASNNAFRADFFACIKNTSATNLNFYDEWNSCGFDRLKIVCYGWREIWIAKQRGTWRANYPSWTSLSPGASLRIPVAFDETLWDGVQKAQGAKDVTNIRLFYDQLVAPTNSFGITAQHWYGCQFSRSYDIGIVLPRRGFRPERGAAKASP